MKEMYRRILMGATGILLLGVCVAMLNESGLGTDPFTVFIRGIASVFNTSYGVIYPIVILVFLVGVFLVDRHFIGIATVLNLFLVGTVCDLTNRFVFDHIDTSGIGQRILLLVIALVVLCFASSLYIVADLGVSSYDAISLIMAEKKVGQYRYCRIATDVTCCIVGGLLGFLMHKGTNLGVGTIITAFCMGPLTQFFITKVSNRLRYGKTQ